MFMLPLRKTHFYFQTGWKGAACHSLTDRVRMAIDDCIALWRLRISCTHFLKYTMHMWPN
jgi:hypothetical protein